MTIKEITITERITRGQMMGELNPSGNFVSAAWNVKTRLRKRGVPVQPRWPAFTLLWVCLQGAFGALTVTWKLFPAIVTLHLLGAVVLLVLLCIQAVRYRQAAADRLPTAVSPAS